MSRVVPAPRRRTRRLTLPGIRSGSPSSGRFRATASQAVDQPGDRTMPIGAEWPSRARMHLPDKPGRAQPPAGGVRSFESSDLRSRSIGMSGNSHRSSDRTDSHDKTHTRAFGIRSYSHRHPQNHSSVAPIRRTPLNRLKAHIAALGSGQTRDKGQLCRRFQLPEHPTSAAAIRHPSRSRSTPPLRLPLGLGQEGPVSVRSGHPTRRRSQEPRRWECTDSILTKPWNS